MTRLLLFPCRAAVYNKPPAAAPRHPPLLLKVQFIVSGGGGVSARRGGAPQKTPAPPGGTPGGCLSSRLKEPASYRSLAGSRYRRRQSDSPVARWRTAPLSYLHEGLCVKHTGGGVILAPHSVTQEYRSWECGRNRKKYSSRKGEEKNTGRDRKLKITGR